MAKPFYLLLFLLCFSLAGWGQVNTEGMEELDGTWETVKFDKNLEKHIFSYFFSNLFQDSIGRICFSFSSHSGYTQACYDGKTSRIVLNDSFVDVTESIYWKGLNYIDAGSYVLIFDPLEEKIIDTIIFEKPLADRRNIHDITFANSENGPLVWAEVRDDKNIYPDIYLSKNRKPFQKISMPASNIHAIIGHNNPTSKTPSLHILTNDQGIIELDTAGEEKSKVLHDLDLSSLNIRHFGVDLHKTYWLHAFGYFGNDDSVSDGLYSIKEGKTRLILKSGRRERPFFVTKNIVGNYNDQKKILYKLDLKSRGTELVRRFSDYDGNPSYLEDQAGTIWVCSEGITKMDLLKFKGFKTYSGHEPIGENKNGDIYFSNGRSLSILVSKTDSIRFIAGSNIGWGYIVWNRSQIYKDIIYSFAHLVALDTETEEINPLNYRAKIIDYNGRAWYFRDNELMLIDLESGDTISRTNQNSPFISLYYQSPSDSTMLILQGEKIIVYNKDGTFKYDFRHKIFEKKEDEQYSKSIHSFYEDDAGDLWIGHDKGLSKLSKGDTSSLQTFEIVSENVYRTEVYSILPDDDYHFLWLGTNKGLYRFDKRTGETLEVLFHSGLENASFSEAYKAKDGRMYFSVYSEERGWHILAFYPKQIMQEYDSLMEKSKNLPIFFRELNKFDPVENKEIPWPDINLPRLKQITLKPKERFFSLEYALADYRRPAEIYYTHMLEGYDKNWSEPSKNANQIRYENLPPATYTLRMKASLFRSCVLPDGGCQERTLKVIILPFWYQTWWAWSLFIGIPLIAIYFFYRYNLKRQLAMAEAQRLQEMDSLKTRLYTNITHEFRTPLTIILGLTDQVKSLFPKSAKTNLKAKEYLSMVRRNGQHLLRLINQLLDLAKLESGTMQLNLIQADVSTFLLYVAESFQSLAEAKGVQLMSFSEAKNLTMDFDPEKLQDIVSNLLSNAIKFTPEGGSIYFVVNTTQTLGVLETPRVWVLTIKVKDTGIGIPADQLPFIFDRFYQVDATSTREGEGTGIGLALTKELVNRMDGRIEVESVVGGGTTFIVSLPIKNEAAIALTHEGEPHAAVIQRFDPASPAGKDSRVQPTSTLQLLNISTPQLLIIEDNPDVTTYIQTCLEADYQIETAKNGQIGIDKALEQVPDIIISDVMMPKKNGYEVCETLKNDERTSHIPIVLLTAKATQADKVTGLQTGADAYLVKPFDKEELLVRLEKLIALRRQLQARYAMLKPVKDGAAPKEDAFVLKLRQVVEDKMDDPDLAVVHLCKAASLSHMQVYRKLKALTNRTPSQFIRSIRLQKAFELLKTTDLTVSEVAYDVGFSDPNYFSRTFLKEFGLRPSVMRK